MLGKRAARLSAFLLFTAIAGHAAVAGGQASMDHSDYDRLLKQYVDTRGLVDYPALCGGGGLDAYTGRLSAADPHGLSRDEALAFWINAYNAFTLKVICDNYPLDSIGELHGGGLVLGTVFKTTIWDKKWFAINGERMSLGHIEHEILRKQFDTPRIHFAIVCAAKSCPPLRNEAYAGERIDRQLDDQGRAFLGRDDLNRFDRDSRTAYLSSIFKWFRKDFGGGQGAILEFVAPYITDPQVEKSLREEPGRWKIKWNEYDWSLNRQ